MEFGEPDGGGEGRVGRDESCKSSPQVREEKGDRWSPGTQNWQLGKTPQEVIAKVTQVRDEESLSYGGGDGDKFGSFKGDRMART